MEGTATHARLTIRASAPTVLSVFGAIACSLAAPPAAGAQPRTVANLSAAATGNHFEEGARPGSWVHPATGELSFLEPADLALLGPMPLVFQRYFAQYLESDGIASRIGVNWLGTFDWKLTVANAQATVVTHRGRVIRFTSPAPGTWQLTGPLDVAYQLAEAGGEFRLLEPLGRRVYAFDAAGVLVRVEDGRGNRHSLTYTGALLTEVADDFGRRLTFTYDAMDRLATASDGTRTVSYGHDGDALASFTDGEGRTTTYVKSLAAMPAYALEATQLPGRNRPWTFTYDALLRVAACADADGNAWTYSRAASATTLTDPVGGTRTYEYDAASRIIRRTDPLGNQTQYAYDPTGRIAGVTRPLGDVVTVEHHAASGYPSRITLPDGEAVLFTYAARAAGGLTFHDVLGCFFHGATDAFTYDGAGNPLTYTDRSGRVWTWTWTPFGLPATAGNPAGGTTTFTYDVVGRLRRLDDAAGVSTHYSYDAMDRLVRITRPDLTEAHFAYDLRDRLTGATDETGSAWTFTYNANGLLEGVTDPVGTQAQVSYIGMDWRLATMYTDATQEVTTYDALQRPIAHSDRTGRTVGHQYDAAGRLIRLLDPAGKAWVFGYDANGRATSETDPLGNVQSFLWNANDRVTRATDPLGVAETYAYDAMSRLIARNGPLGYDRAYQYDPRSLLRVVDEVSLRVELPRGPLGQVEAIVDPNGRTWDAVFDGAGRATSFQNPLGRLTTYGYDGRGRPSTVTSPAGSVSFTYDAASRLVQRSYSDDRTRSYTYDAAGRLLTADGASFSYDPWGRMVESNGVTVGRDAAGRITSITYAPGRTVTYTYESRGLIQSIQDWLGGTFTFTHDDAQRRTRITRPNGVTTEYQYDAASRLIRTVERTAEEILSIHALTRDARGQIVQAERQVPLRPPGAAARAFAYDEANQIVGYAYDGLGRLVDNDGAGPNFIQYDLASNVLSYEQDGAGATFTYDGLGMPITRTEGPATRAWIWNYALPGPALAIVREGPADGSYFLYTPSGELLARYDAAPGPCCAVRYSHFDESGNAIFLTDETGAVTARYAYSPYGEAIEAFHDPKNPFTFGGRHGAMREGGGFYRMGRRLYDSKAARFVSGRAAWPTSNTLEGLDFAPGPVLFTGQPVDFAGDANWSWHLGDAACIPQSSIDLSTSLCAPLRDLGVKPDRFDPYKNRSVNSFQYGLQNPVEVPSLGGYGIIMEGCSWHLPADGCSRCLPPHGRLPSDPWPFGILEGLPCQWLDLQQGRVVTDQQQGRLMLDAWWRGLEIVDLQQARRPVDWGVQTEGAALHEPAEPGSYTRLVTPGRIADFMSPEPMDRFFVRINYFQPVQAHTAEDGTADVRFTPVNPGKIHIRAISDRPRPQIKIRVRR